MTVNGDFYLSKDTIINITMSKIHDMLYEDFDNTDDNETPDGWINLSPEVNYKRFVYVKEHVLVFKQWLQNYDKSIFVSPEIDMSVAGILNFDLGEKYYHPQLEIGTMSNPDSANTFKKIIVIEPENGEMKHITVDLSDYPGFDKYLAFRMPETNLNAHFTLDNIKLQTDSNEGRYVATVIVRDEQNNPIKDATIAMGDSTHITDSNGVAYFIKLESGDYNFTVSSNYYSSNSGSIIIDDNNAETTILLQPLGVNDDLSSKVSVFPNPAKNIIIISSDKFINKINIYDITGRLLLKENQLMKNSTIDLSEFNRGILIINIKFEDNTAYNNVIIKQ
jgi:hypothetical protein